MSFTRVETLQRLRRVVESNGVIVGAGAKCAEAVGIDLIIIYNSGRFRMAGRGSLAGLMPYGDANAIVVQMAQEVLPVVHDTPVLAGVCGTDPFRKMTNFLRDLKELGSRASRTFRRSAYAMACSERTWKRRA